MHININLKNLQKSFSKSVLTLILGIVFICNSNISFGQNIYGQILKKHAVVGISDAFMREKPDYDEELGNQLLMGTVVDVLDSERYWTKVLSPDPYTAWINTMALEYMNDDEISEYIATPKYICTTDYTHIHSKPCEKSQSLTDFILGDIVRIWFKEGKKVKKRGFYGVILPNGEKGYVSKKDVQEMKSWAENSKANFENLKETAFRFLGVPYMWGGTSIKSVDCSGFTKSIWFANGVLLPRNASQQARAGEKVDFAPDWSISEDSPKFRDEMMKRLKYLQPGDLLFFGKRGVNGGKDRVTHVAFYLGDGKYIHSAQKVRISTLDPNIKGVGGYERAFISARRIIGNEDCGKNIVSIKNSTAYFPQ